MRIIGDTWIPGIKDFRITSDVQIPGNLKYVKDLMIDDGCNWNTQLVDNIFSGDIVRKIKMIKILVQPEHEVLF